jgi:hypothetical protein
MKYSGRPFTLDELVMKIKGKDDSPETLLGYLNKKVQEQQSMVGISITNATQQKYCRCIKHLKEFLKLKYENNDTAVSSVNSSMITV